MQRPTTPPLYKPPSNVPFHIHLTTWSASEIGSFLSLHRCGHHSKTFRDNDITGSVILELGAEELKGLGVTKVGERVRLLGAIRELKKRNSVSLSSLTSGITTRTSYSGGSAPQSASLTASPQAQQPQRQHHQRTASALRQGETLDFGNASIGSGIELQLNGHSTRSERHPTSQSLGTEQEAEALRDPSSLTRNRSGTNGSSNRRLHAFRPPPLHLHSSSHGQISNSSGQGQGASHPTGGKTQGGYNSGSQVTTPKGLPISAMSGTPGSDGSGPMSSSQNVVTSQGFMTSVQPASGSSVDTLPPISALSLTRSSSLRNRANVYPTGISGNGTNIPAPQGSNGKLRAPLPINAQYGTSPTGTTPVHGRKSPSNGNPSNATGPSAGRRGSKSYMERPLPGLPPTDSLGGSEVLMTDGPDDVGSKKMGSISSKTGPNFGKSQGPEHGRPSTSSGALGVASVNQHHRRVMSNTAPHYPPPSNKLPSPPPFGSDTRRYPPNQRANTSAGTVSNVHPYASSALRPIHRGQTSPTKASGSPTRAKFTNNSIDSRGDITPTFQPDVNESRRWFSSSPVRSPNPNDDPVSLGKTSRGQSYSDRWGPEKGTPTLSLEDVKRKLVKFILVEDETSRTIDVEACQTGFEVLEKALRKFGKWRGLARGATTGLSESESETDETSCLDVDGWGVFLEKVEDGE